jgi:hypothetical protein
VSAFYTNLARTASNLIAKFGADISFKRETGGSIDPVTGVTIPGTVETLTAKGIFQRIPDDLVDGSRILASDRLLVIEAKFEPVMTDKVVIDNQNWPIEEIAPVNPAGTPITYVLRVRR